MGQNEATGAQLISVALPAATVAALRARAAGSGQSLESYLEQMSAPAGDAPPVTDDEWDRLLDELGAAVPPLPADFSRADIYADHN